MRIARQPWLRQDAKDPEFVEELKKRNWELDPVGGEELRKLARQVVKQPADVAAALERILGQ